MMMVFAEPQGSAKRMALIRIKYVEQLLQMMMVCFHGIVLR